MKRARNFPAVWETRGEIPVYAAAGGGENNNVISVFNLVVPIFCRMSPVAPFRSLRYNADGCCSIFIPYLFFLSTGPPSHSRRRFCVSGAGIVCGIV